MEKLQKYQICNKVWHELKLYIISSNYITLLFVENTDIEFLKDFYPIPTHTAILMFRDCICEKIIYTNHKACKQIRQTEINPYMPEMKLIESAYSVDPDEVAQKEPPHLDQHCLPSSL